MEPHVSIKNLRKVFNGNGPEPVTAIDGLSLDCRSPRRETSSSTARISPRSTTVS